MASIFFNNTDISLHLLVDLYINRTFIHTVSGLFPVFFYFSQISIPFGKDRVIFVGHIEQIILQSIDHSLILFSLDHDIHNIVEIDTHLCHPYHAFILFLSVFVLVS